MPHDAIVGGIFRIIGSAIASIAECLAEYIFERVGRIVIYALTLGRVDTDQSTTEGINCISAVAGFLAVGGFCWVSWRIIS